MSEPFIAEIRIFAGNFAPRGWAFCNGQLLPIAQNTALFSLIGTTYGGDGRDTTALPNMEGRAPMHPGRGPGLTSRRLGQRVGTETVHILESQLPNHSHTPCGTTSRGDQFSPADTRSLARAASPIYANPGQSASGTLAYEAVSVVGGGQSHNNVQPLIALNFIIALVGLYPSRG